MIPDSQSLVRLCMLRVSISAFCFTLRLFWFLNGLILIEITVRQIVVVIGLSAILLASRTEFRREICVYLLSVKNTSSIHQHTYNEKQSDQDV